MLVDYFENQDNVFFLHLIYTLFQKSHSEICTISNLLVQINEKYIYSSGKVIHFDNCIENAKTAKNAKHLIG